MTDGLEQLGERLKCARFLWLGVVYVVVVILVWHFTWRGQPPSRDYVAAVPMILNHRVVASDLRVPDDRFGWLGFYMKPMASLEGKYVKPKQGISADTPVNETMLSDRPDMTLPDKTSAVVFPSADAKVMGLLDTGSPVTLFGPDSDPKAAVSIPATVHVILCDPAGGDAKTCYLVLRIAESQAPFVLKSLSTLKLAPASVPLPPQSR